MGEVSKGVVVTLLVLTIVVSVFTTLTMVNVVNDKISDILSRPSTQGTVSVNIVNPETIPPANPISGTVSLNIASQ